MNSLTKQPGFLDILGACALGLVFGVMFAYGFLGGF